MYSIRRGLGSAPSPAVSAALQNASSQTGVPLSLLQALAQQESSNNPSAVSSAGAQGLLQLMPATAASVGVTNPFDPNQNALGGAQYLDSLYKQYGDWNTALIAYNEGPGNLANKGIFPSSQSYADTILANAGLTEPSDLSGNADVAPTDASNPLDLSALVSAGTPNWTLIGAGVAVALLLAWSLN